jgi:hypothetical protein
MSLAYFITVNHADPSFDTFVNGKFVAREVETLNQLALQLEVTPFDGFLSLDESLAEEFDIDASNAPVNVWFTAEQGLETIDALIKHLEQHPKAVKNVKGILGDLQEYQTVLNQVKAKGLRWHFEIDF